MTGRASGVNLYEGQDSVTAIPVSRKCNYFIVGKTGHSFPQGGEVQNAGRVFRAEQQVLEILCFEREIRVVAHLFHPVAEFLVCRNALPLRKIVHVRSASGAQEHGVVEVPALSSVENGGELHCIQRSV